MDGVVWKGSPNHYQGRNGYQVTHITLHIMVGYLAGTDATFANPSSQASAHYGVGATGEIHQYVSETDGSYSDANYASNNSTISIEHEGGLAQAPVTDAEIEASARLMADIARRYGWSRLWHDGLNGNVWLHREIPGTDHAGCPDRTVNGLPVDRLIARANELLTGNTTTTIKEEPMTALILADDDTGVWHYWSPQTGRIGLANMDEASLLQQAGLKVVHYRKDLDWAGRADDISKRVRTVIDAQEAAQTAAIEALSKAMGADPDQIAQAVQDAVTAKLDSLEITITATDRDDQ